jgi:hypothetical protein
MVINNAELKKALAAKFGPNSTPNGQPIPAPTNGNGSPAPTQPATTSSSASDQKRATQLGATLPRKSGVIPRPGIPAMQDVVCRIFSIHFVL